MIRFDCPSCGHSIKAPDDAAGKTGKCKCGERVRIPAVNPFDQAMAERNAPKREAALHEETGFPRVETRQDPVPSPRPAKESPGGELILCYACRKQVADNAPTC